MSEFFAMGGYWPYVWGSYAVTFGLLAVEIALLWRRAHKSMRGKPPLPTTALS
jgi:heme exporter protein CcmD